MEKYKVACYGSLKSGFPNNRVLGRSKFMGEFKTQPLYTMYSLGGYPGIVDGGDTPIVCECYEVDEDTMLRLDCLEGYPSFYNRSLIDTPYGEAWVYHLAQPERYSNRPVVESGVWEQPKWA
jgi:gamma-glutamylaminecyclotransferase